MTTVLLDKLNSLIEKYGGNDKLADDIEKEWLKITHRPPAIRDEVSERYYHNWETEFITAHHNKHTAEWIATELKRPVSGIRGKIHRMQQLSILKKVI